MKYIVLIFIALIMFSCVTVSNRSNVFNLNTIGNNEGVLKTNGYYYCELEEQAYPYYKNEYGGYSQDTSKPYIKKMIQPLLLYKNGGVHRWPLTSGMKENRYDQMACGLPDDNSFFFAKVYFECSLMRGSKPDRGKFGTLYAKGVFKTQQDKIVVQYYECTGPPMTADYYLIEKTGKILNDTTFVLKSMYNFRSKESTDINEVYLYQHYTIKPDSANYILNHKKRFKK